MNFEESSSLSLIHLQEMQQGQQCSVVFLEILLFLVGLMKKPESDSQLLFCNSVKRKRMGIIRAC